MRGGYRQNAGRKQGFATLEAERMRDFIAHKLETEFEPILNKAIEQAKEGNYRAREWLTDRAYGKTTQALDIDKKGEPFIINLIDYSEIIRNSTDEQLIQIINTKEETSLSTVLVDSK